MTFSLCLSYFNAKRFKSPIDIWGNFVPGMIFFQSIFGYLVFTIIYKWSVDWYAKGQAAPGLLNMLIYMFLSPGTIEAPLYRGQAGVQTILLLLAFICVPILLFLKPFYLRHEYNKKRALGYRGLGEQSRISALDDDDDEEGQTLNGRRGSLGDDDEGVAIIAQDLGHEEHEEFEFSEIMIHQVIHTIGMAIGSVVPQSTDVIQNSASIASRILLRICDCGHCPSLISSSPSYFGT
jgi:V-type H+-transporting ATPase subunit a